MISKRKPGERAAYVEGYAEGWKAALHLLLHADVLTKEQERVALERLDQHLDLASAIENAVRAQEAASVASEGTEGTR